MDFTCDLEPFSEIRSHLKIATSVVFMKRSILSNSAVTKILSL